MNWKMSYIMICDFISCFHFLLIGGKPTVVGIMEMMDCFIVDKERERLLDQHIQLEMSLVVVLTMLHRNSFSRKIAFPFFLK